MRRRRPCARRAPPRWRRRRGPLRTGAAGRTRRPRTGRALRIGPPPCRPPPSFPSPRNFRPSQRLGAALSALGFPLPLSIVWFPGGGLFPSSGGGRATQKEEQITQIGGVDQPGQLRAGRLSPQPAQMYFKSSIAVVRRGHREETPV